MTYHIGPARPEERSVAYRFVIETLDADRDERSRTDSPPESGTRFLVARDGDHIRAAVAIEPRAPGLSSIVIPTASAAESALRRALFQAAVRYWQAQSPTTAVLMVEPNDIVAAQSALELGFTRGAEIAFMERVLAQGTCPPFVWNAPAIKLAATSDDELLKMLEQTLLNSLDCPSLQEVVGAQAMLAGFSERTRVDLRHWCLVRFGDDNVGCLLLDELADGVDVELTYMGISPQFRGLGLGRAIVVEAITYACERQSERVTLAVDNANTPAMRIYQSLDFRPFGHRVMWLKRGLSAADSPRS